MGEGAARGASTEAQPAAGIGSAGTNVTGTCGVLGAGSTCTAAAEGSSDADVAHSAVAEAIRRAALAPPTAPVVLLQEHWKAAQANASYLERQQRDHLLRLEPSGRSMQLPHEELPAADSLSSYQGSDTHFGACVVDLNVDAERLLPILTEWLPPRLRAGSWVVAVLQLGSSNAGRERKLAHLCEPRRCYAQATPPDPACCGSLQTGSANARLFVAVLD